MSVPENVIWRPHPRCRRPHAFWSAPDEQATEEEVTEMLRALVRLTKPETVVETGAYHGRTTAAIASALELNGAGRVTTYEIDAAAVEIAKERLEPWTAAGVVLLVAAAASADNLPPFLELAFLDSCMTCRAGEMLLVWPRLAPGGIVVVHDAAPGRPPGRVRPPGPHARLDVATPRGLAIFQRAWT